MRTVKGGWLDGHPIRKARKRHACDNATCNNVIRIGESYVEGFVDPYRAGGFGFERFCLDCAGEEARASASQEQIP